MGKFLKCNMYRITGNGFAGVQIMQNDMVFGGLPLLVDYSGPRSYTIILTGAVTGMDILKTA